MKKLIDASDDNLTLAQALFDINKNLCEIYHGLNPLALLDYPAEDVFELIYNHIDYNRRHDSNNSATTPKVIRRQAGDNWF